MNETTATTSASAAGYNNRVLIVDDQYDIHEDFREMLAPPAPSSTDALAAAFLEEGGGAFPPTFELLHARNGEEACATVAEANGAGEPIAMAFVDIRMPPGMDGVATARRIRETDPNIEFVLMTAYTDRSLPDIVEHIAPLHKLLYIRKPFTREEIQQITTALVEKYNVEQQLDAHERELTASHRRLEAILGATDEAIAMFDRDGRLAFANRRFEELCGAAPGALIGQPAAASQPRVRPVRAADLQYASLFGDEQDLCESHGDLRRGVFHRSERDVLDADGWPIGRLHVYRDLSTQIDNRRMDAEMRHLRLEVESAYSFSGIVGESRAMRRVFGRMERAAEGGMSVLIRGESGTGKELVAKALHFNGPRKDRRLEVVNCAALPDTLVETELFGHERGAFTGAVARHLGAFERADGGTVFLDEIGDMKPDLQAKLLRVLQEREIQRVGGNEWIPIDVQIIAATNQDLEQAMEAGTFRQDLYYRIAAFPIEIPPLRRRPEDIPLLAAHFLEQAREGSDRNLAGFAPEAMERLVRHDWPGNVRELESAVRRAAVLASSEFLQADDLWPDGGGAGRRGGLGGADGTGLATLAEVERQTIERALSLSGHNITRAARALGIDRGTLHRKVRKLGLGKGKGKGKGTGKRS